MVYQLFNLIFSWFALANYYIAFAILSESMEDKSFNLKGIATVNLILNYFYLGLLMMCFILSLGNRPQGSKWGYTASMIGFSIVTIYMTVRFFFSSFEFWGCWDLMLRFLVIDAGGSVPSCVQGYREPCPIGRTVDV